MRGRTISPAVPCPAMTRPNACSGARRPKRSPASRPISPQQQLGLKVYDCYRPTRAVAAFARWAQQRRRRRDQALLPQARQTPAVRRRYIAAHSAHSTGIAVDLTLVPFAAPRHAAFDPHAAYGACTAPADATRAGHVARHGHRLRLLRRQSAHRERRRHARTGAAARAPRRRHAPARLPQLLPRMVALLVRRAAGAGL